MLIRSVMIGDSVLPAALDSCATNCFLSEKLSQKMKAKGYPPVRSAVRYDVEQGRPLCSTNMVHFLPVSMVSEEGKLVEWEFCLFIVANCGAEAIIGFPTLSQGNIIQYDPPEDYVRTLHAAVAKQTKANKQTLQERARWAAMNAQTHTYGPPQRMTECLRTSVRPEHCGHTTAEEPQAVDQSATVPENATALVLSTDASEHGWAATLTSADGTGAQTTIDSFYNLHESFHLRESDRDENMRDANYASGVDFSQDPDEVRGAGPITFRRVPTGTSVTPEQIQAEVRRQLAQLVAEGIIASTYTSTNVPTDKGQQSRKPQARSPGTSTANSSMTAGDGQCGEELTEKGCKPPPRYTDREKPTIHVPNDKQQLQSALVLNTDVVQNTAKVKRKKGKTNALTEAEPYGINPPLDAEVLEALATLKTLSETLPEEVWSKSQLTEIQTKLSHNRPEWAQCLTPKHLNHTFDKVVAGRIERLMDDTYKESVFGKSLKYPAKVKQFEINSKPGEDNWAPQKARRFKNPVMYDVVDTWLDWQLADELLSPSNAVRPAVITVVEKEGREPRTCCDYRLRNARTEVPTFPMPDIGEHVDDSIGYKYYCSFDMAKMFNQIELKKEHRDLAAFITHRGVHAPHRVQFGLAGGPQHAVREVGGMMALDPLTNGEDYTAWALNKNEEGVTRNEFA